jgi:hypothetical protein
MHDQATRMLNEARSRIHDADLLSQSLLRETDSDAFLRILGFEILLKCALVVTGIKPARHHKYVQLWRELPSGAQATVLAAAGSRMRGHADLSNLDNLLNWYQFVFEKARYHYELYEGYSLQEQRELGRKLPRLVDSSKLEFPLRANARGNALAAGFPARRAV